MCINGHIRTLSMGSVAQWVARLARKCVGRGFEFHQRPQLFHWARNYPYCL